MLCRFSILFKQLTEISLRTRDYGRAIGMGKRGGWEGEGEEGQGGVKTRIVRNIIASDTDANANHGGDVITADVEKGDPGACSAFIYIYSSRP